MPAISGLNRIERAGVFLLITGTSLGIALVLMGCFASLAHPISLKATVGVISSGGALAIASFAGGLLIAKHGSSFHQRDERLKEAAKLTNFEGI